MPTALTADPVEPALHAARDLLRGLELTAADRPEHDPDLLADRVADAVTEAQADVDQALADERPGLPARLARQLALLRHAEATLYAAALHAPRRHELQRMALRRGGEWPAWHAALTPALDGAWRTLRAAGDAVLIRLLDHLDPPAR